jgi:Methyltransferase domain
VFFHLIEDHRLPFDNASVDGVFAKNVFEYVSDLAVSLGEARRVLKAGGRVTGICCDYGFYVAEPLSPVEVRELFDAAAPAFRDPFIGRRLRQAMRTAGFDDVQTTVLAMPDVTAPCAGCSRTCLGMRSASVAWAKVVSRSCVAASMMPLRRAPTWLFSRCLSAQAPGRSTSAECPLDARRRHPPWRRVQPSCASTHPRSRR